MIILKRLIATTLTIATLNSFQVYGMNPETNQNEIEMDDLSRKFAAILLEDMGPEIILNKINNFLVKENGRCNAENFVALLQLHLLDQNKTLCHLKNSEGTTLLHLACKKDMIYTLSVILNVVSEDRTELLALLKQMSTEKGTYAKGTILHWAAHYKQPKMLSKIFSVAGGDLQEVFKILSTSKNNAFQTAIASNHLETVKVFLDAIAQKLISLSNAQAAQILKAAIEIGNQEIVTLLLRAINKKHFSLSNDDPTELLQDCIKTNNLKMFTLLVQAMSENIFTLSDADAAKILNKIVGNGHLEMLQVFLQKADQNAWTWLTTLSDKGTTALSSAIRLQKHAIVERIVNFVGDRAYELATSPDIDGTCALDDALNSCRWLWFRLQGQHLLDEMPNLFSCFEYQQI